MKKNLLAVLLSAALIPAGAAAQTVYNVNENKIVVSHDKKEYINIMITKENSTGETPFYIRQFLAEGDIEIPMPENAKTGTYFVYVGENKAFELEFFYLNIEEADKYVKNSVNTVKTAEELKTAVINGFDKLNIKFDETADADKVCEILIKKLPFENSASLRNELQTAQSVVKIQTAEQESFDTLLSENAEILGIDYEIYGSLADDEKIKMRDLLKKADYSEITFADYYAEAAVVAKCCTAQHYSALRTVVAAGSKILGIDITSSKYNNLSDKSQVYVKMMEHQSEWETADDIKKSFDEAVDELYGNKGGGGGSGSGAGGGSKSNAGGNAYQVPITAPIVENTEKISFSDLNNVEWARQAIEVLAEKDIINGTGNGLFEPERSVTRAEFAKMIYIAFGIEKGESSFSDVLPGDWYFEAVGALAAAKIVNGFEGRFNPNETVTRQDAAVILRRTAEYKGIEIKGASQFADENDIDNYAVESVLAMAGSGIISGYNNRFYPKDETLRAQAAVMIYNTLKISGVVE